MSSNHELFEKVIDAFSPISTTNIISKGDFLNRPGRVAQELYLVKSGLLRSFYYREGRDITAHFAMENGVIGAADSLIDGRSSIYYIEAIEQTTVVELNYGEMEKYLDKNPHYERLARQFSQLLYLDLVERFEGMNFMSSEMRYKHFLNKYPDLIQRVNLGHIASYLGITQETLSRVRAQKIT